MKHIGIVDITTVGACICANEIVTEYIRRNTTGAEVHALTSPLLTKSDGKKFGKSEEGNIWLDPQLTSPYKFYQFWINADDQDLSKFLRIFSLKDKTAIEQLEADSTSNPQVVKRELAEELTRRIHSDEAYVSAMQVSELLFNPKVTTEFLHLLTDRQYRDIAGELPGFTLHKDQFHNATIADLLTSLAPICSSKSEARKAIQNQAISVNKVKINDHEQTISTEQIIRGQWMIVENGKKNKYLIEVK